MARKYERFRKNNVALMNDTQTKEPPLYLQ